MHAGTAEERLAGYLDALRERKVRSSQRLIRHTDYRAGSARQAVAALLDRPGPPDSFFVANSSMALGVLEELTKRRLLPGRDVGLIAFDDAPWTPFVNPPMSVVAQPAYEIGARAGELLLDRIGGASAESGPRTVTLSTTLVLRASSRRSARRRS